MALFYQFVKWNQTLSLASQLSMQNLSVSQSSQYRALFMNNLGNIQRESGPCSQIIPKIFPCTIKPLDSTSGCYNLEAASRIQGRTVIDYCFLLLFSFCPSLGLCKAIIYNRTWTKQLWKISRSQSAIPMKNHHIINGQKQLCYIFILKQQQQVT